MTCVHPGDLCGYTLNTGHGRMPMYQCRLHPTKRVYKETIACTDHERGYNDKSW